MRTIVLSTALLLACTQVFCQANDSTARLIFGFDLGLNYSNLIMKNSPPGAKATNGMGFRMGLLADWRLGKNISFSPKAELSFNNASFTGSDDYEAYAEQVYPVLFEFSAHTLFYAGGRLSKPYVLVGPSYRQPLTENKKFFYVTERPDFAIDFGIGLDKKLTFFNVAPELRYSVGLTNLRKVNYDDELYFHNVTLVLIFKG